MPRIGRVNFRKRPFLRKLGQHLEGGMKKAAMYAERQAKQKVSRGNKSGGNPSEAGEPPKVVTGRLRNSITHEIRYSMADPLGLKGQIGSVVDYAVYLELGTEKMKARPFLRPTVIDNQARILKLIANG